MANFKKNFACQVLSQTNEGNSERNVWTGASKVRTTASDSPSVFSGQSL